MKSWVIGLLIFLLVTGIILAIALPISAQKTLEATEVGLDYDRTKIKVNDKTLYSNGRHTIGVNHKFFKYGYSMSQLLPDPPFSQMSRPCPVFRLCGISGQQFRLIGLAVQKKIPNPNSGSGVFFYKKKNFPFFFWSFFECSDETCPADWHLLNGF